MRSLVLHGVKKLGYEAGWPTPAIPEGWAMVNVKASGICGSDMPRVMQTGTDHHPTIPGHEFSGTVTMAKSSSVKAGDRVAGMPIIPCGRCSGCEIGLFHCMQYDFIGSRRDGGFADYCVTPAENLVVLPAGVTYEEGAFIEPLAVTLHVLRRSGMVPGARVSVYGGSAIGILTAQWAGIQGASEVVSADIREESPAVAAACGIKRVVNPLSDEFKSLGEFDHQFEAAGSSAALLSATARARPKP